MFKSYESGRAVSTFLIFAHIMKIIKKEWLVWEKWKKMGEPYGSPLIHVTLSVFYLALAYFVRITI
jgi:hypothetical protein